MFLKKDSIRVAIDSSSKMYLYFIKIFIYRLINFGKP
jgi:hypothetical protein